MFFFNLSIKNIFSNNKTASFINHIYERNKKLSKYKNLEIEIYNNKMQDLFSLLIDLNLGGYDHCGPQFEISIFGFYFNIKIYDSRHWDYENNCWENI